MKFHANLFKKKCFKLFKNEKIKKIKNEINFNKYPHFLNSKPFYKGNINWILIIFVYLHFFGISKICVPIKYFYLSISKKKTQQSYQKNQSEKLQCWSHKNLLKIVHKCHKITR